MKDLIKRFQTPRGEAGAFIYIYRTDESDTSTQVLYSAEEGAQMISEGEAVEVSFDGSYIETQKLAEHAAFLAAE